MRILHTSDWHLGRLFHGVHLTEDQAHVLDQLVDLVAEADVDVVIVAGDLYDRAVPPDAAVSLLGDVLERIVLGHGVPVVAIAGNHDSARRVGFGARLLGGQGLHVVGPVQAPPVPVVLADAHGPVHLHPLPYAEPSEVRLAFEEAGARTHDEAMRVLTAACERAPDARHVAIAHAFVVGGEASDSERPLSVGGAETVGVDAFDGFDYVALGHLHRPQQAGGRASVRYSGSLLKYSFSEADHRKGVLLVDLDAEGASTVETVALAPRRDVRVLEGAFADLLAAPPEDASREDYLLVRLTDEGTLHDPMARLQQVYPNALQLQRTVLGTGSGDGAAPRGHRTMTELELFADFHEHATGNALDDAAREIVEGVVRARHAERREGHA